jgi:hypothetical protein
MYIELQSSRFRGIVIVILAILLIILSVVYIFWLNGHRQANFNESPWPFILAIILSNLITFFLIWSIVKVLKLLTSSKYNDSVTRKNLNRGLSDFIIGDENTYSLSRLQAVLWAIVIISYQLSIIFSLLLRANGVNNLFYYELTFSEPILWLLGLSLGTSISVKGITVDQLNHDPIRSAKRIHRIPQPLDIIMGPNGFDFSKCQMLIWTLVAIFVFNTKVYEFNKAIYNASTGDDKYNVKAFFQKDNFYEEYKDNRPYDPKKPFIPYLSYTFIVLMGLSQGAYVGKKLVPTFKLGELKNINEDRLSALMDQLVIKKQLFSDILLTTKGNVKTPADLLNINNLQKEIDALQLQIADLTNQISEINNVNV